MTNILEIADGLVNGERSQDYGHPLDDFATVAAMMTALLRRKGKLAPGAEIDYRDHVMWMQCVKMAREHHAPKVDNRIDGAGYFETVNMVLQEKQRRLEAAGRIPGEPEKE